MSTDETVGRPDVIDMCDEWLRLDFPASCDGGPAATAVRKCLEQTMTRHDESSYCPLSPTMQGA